MPFLAAVAIAIASSFIPTVVMIGVSFAFNAITRLFIGSPKAPSFSQDAFTNQISLRQPIGPWRIIYGRQRLGGHITYIEQTGTSKEYIHVIYTMAGHEVEDIPKMYIDNIEVPVDGFGDATGKYAGFIHWEKKLGTTTQTAYATLVSASASLWTNDHRQRGRANCYVRFKLNANLFPAGIPMQNVTFDVKGKKVYDTRSATTGYSENSALCLRDYLCDTSYGVGVLSTEIDETVCNAEANTCDENVSLAAGGTEDRYTTNGSFDSSQVASEVIPRMLSAMGGRLTYTSGKFGIYAGSYRTPTVTLTQTDLRKSLRGVKTRRSRRELFNGVKGVFIDPNNGWKPTDFPAYTKGTDRGYGSDAYYAEDGNERIWLDAQFPFTITASTAQRLSKILLERNRRQISVPFVGKLTCYRNQVPDTVQFTYSRYGWSAKTFEVVNSQFSQEEDKEGAPILGVDLQLEETDSNVFAWTTADELTRATVGTMVVPTPETVAAPTSLVLSSGSTTVLTRTDGIKISRLKAVWVAPAEQTVISGGTIEVQYKKNSSGTWIDETPVAGASLETYIMDVDDGVSYDVRVRSVNTFGAVSAYATVTLHTVTGVSSDFIGNLNGLAAARVGEVLIDSAGIGYLRGTRFTTANPGKKGTSEIVLAGGTGVDGGNTYISVATGTINVPHGVTSMTLTLAVAQSGTTGVNQLSTGNNLKIAIGAVSAERSGNGTVTVTGLSAGEQTVTFYIKTTTGTRDSVDGDVRIDRYTPFATGSIA